ncbi:hypothetical protein J6590_062656 [Homalodisca vitripennis]|nr:hypothetical protein J6590_062656 [Homalodisca vitripennis]
MLPRQAPMQHKFSIHLILTSTQCLSIGVSALLQRPSLINPMLVDSLINPMLVDRCVGLLQRPSLINPMLVDRCFGLLQRPSLINPMLVDRCVALLRHPSLVNPMLVDKCVGLLQRQALSTQCLSIGAWRCSDTQALSTQCLSIGVSACYNAQALSAQCLSIGASACCNAQALSTQRLSIGASACCNAQALSTQRLSIGASACCNTQALSTQCLSIGVSACSNAQALSTQRLSIGASACSNAQSFCCYQKLADVVSTARHDCRPVTVTVTVTDRVTPCLSLDREINFANITRYWGTAMRLLVNKGNLRRQQLTHYTDLVDLLGGGHLNRSNIPHRTHRGEVYRVKEPINMDEVRFAEFRQFESQRYGMKPSARATKANVNNSDVFSNPSVACSLYSLTISSLQEI